MFKSFSFPECCDLVLSQSKPKVEERNHNLLCQITEKGIGWSWEKTNIPHMGTKGHKFNSFNEKIKSPIRMKNKDQARPIRNLQPPEILECEIFHFLITKGCDLLFPSHLRAYTTITRTP